MNRNLSPLKIVIYFTAFSFLWIISSDVLVSKITKDPETYTKLSIVKGWLYMLLTAAFLYWLIALYSKQRTQSEIALRENEQRFRVFFESHGSVMMLIDPDTGGIVDANRAAADYYGFTRDTLRNMAISDINLLPPDELTTQRRHAAVNQYNLFVVPHLVAGGEIRTVEVHTSPIEVNQKKLLFSIIHDITERKRAEIALRERKELLRTVVENTPVVLFALDVKGVFTLSEGRGLVALGLKPGEVVGQSVFDVYRNLPALLEGVRRALDGEIFSFEAKVAELVFEVSYHPVRNDLHELTGTIGVAIDITERKATEEELKEYQTDLEEMVAKRTADLEKTISQLEREVNERKCAEDALEGNRKLLHDVFESIQDGIAVLDTEHNIIMANSAAESLFGCSDLIGVKAKKCFEVCPYSTEQCGNCMSVKAMEEKTVQTETISYKLEGSDARSVEIFTFPFYGRRGKIKGVIQYLRDITDRKRAEEALKESEKRFKKQLDNAPIAISIVNRDGTVEYVNRKHPEIMGYDLRDIPTLEHWWSQAYPDETDRTRIKTAWQELCRRVFQGEQITGVNRKVVCKDGTIKELELSFRAAAAPDKIIVAFGDITERKRAEKKLRDSELHYRTLFEKASEGIIFIDGDGTIVAVNESFAHMHGYSCEKILNMHINDLEARTDFKKDSEITRRLLTGESVLVEVEHYHADGHTFPMEVSITFTEINDKRCFLCFHRDITDRNKVQRELQEKEAKMRAMLESFDGLIYICSVDYRVEFMNENLIQRTGRNAVGERCYAVLNDRDSICPWCVNDRISREEIIRYEIQSPKDGRWYHVVNTPIHYGGGSLSKLTMFVDITERKKADLALKESEELYRRLLASVTDYIYAVRVEDGRSVATRHGDGCLTVTGYTPEEYQTDPDLWDHIVYCADRDSATQQWRAITSGQKTEPLEYRIVHRNGSIRWVRNTVVPRFDKLGKLMAIDGLISDITEKKMLEEKLNLARKLEEENMKRFPRVLIETQEEERLAIARELHDEIGQSLTGLKLYVESISNSMLPDHAGDMRAIESSLGEMLHIVRNMSLNLRPSMLDDFGLVSTLKWYFERYKLQTGISVNFTQTVANKRFSQKKEISIYRITQEALTNAARHADVKCILVELIIAQGRITLSITDKGRGFDIENTGYCGSGLSIMRERAILLKGTFSLSSSPGKGTEIIVTIPLHDREDEREAVL